ncbi:hypothetical protein CASFOL_003009 [Castilleja foliolosa]|uniref:Homeobox domain-containing protein n=1 Tax=Castilleja foliolosa TaxID=1961234 RepID=A0ABD3EG78_9LAMI
MDDELENIHSCEMHSEDDKALRENNKKRTVKTNAQVQALENFYNEHKYPPESMKLQFAVSIGLTEKQVSGWFCHRRIKDKRILNVSTVIQQDHVSGPRQDSCGSTKQADDRNFDAREVESQRPTLHEYYRGPHNRMDDASSVSNSSLRNNMTNQGNLVPKFSTDTETGAKTRPGPAGYLKVRGQSENNAITVVKRQLGNHYREDGPPLSVEFDLLPPGAFEPLMQNPDDGDIAEACYNEETVLPTSPDFSNMVRPSLKMPQVSDISDNHVRQKYKSNTTFSSKGAYYPGNEISGSDSRDDYGMRYRSTEITRASSFPSNHHLLPFGGNLRRETIENGSSNLTTNGFEYQDSFDQMQSRQVVKDDKNYSDRRITNENQILAPYMNGRNDLKRTRHELPQQLHLKKSSVVDNQLRTYQVARSVAAMPAGYSDDDTSSSGE